MLEVVMLRHGKSDWDAPYGHDAQRPLATRGRNAAAAMGRFLTAAARSPDLVVSSPATRALQTAEIAAESGGWNAPLEIVEALYGGGAEAVLMTLRALPAGIRRPLLVGHEPTWSEAIDVLMGGGDVRMPTAGCAGLDVLVPAWSGIGPGACRLRWLFPPRMLPS
jgi:phosphohistidine phosphatase